MVLVFGLKKTKNKNGFGFWAEKTKNKNGFGFWAKKTKNKNGFGFKTKTGALVSSETRVASNQTQAYPTNHTVMGGLKWHGFWFLGGKKPKTKMAL